MLVAMAMVLLGEVCPPGWGGASAGEEEGATLDRCLFKINARKSPTQGFRSKASLTGGGEAACLQLAWEHPGLGPGCVSPGRALGRRPCPVHAQPCSTSASPRPASSTCILDGLVSSVYGLI